MLKIEKGKFLDKNFTQCLKGIACLIIALHHYSQYNSILSIIRSCYI